ncbi:uncharacterized protein LOC126906751 [Daktulosphaira vitifoliae]|uniref:uncharacterized protein LOC126906751 n=1 Tax=Daktulosphaira vitifoliae TaxID=58002 RepID=UPI0021AAAF94|nr:uncharacterized protein LOC126906751 [Daktulosphaira vitifoliae]XP_050543530.1 uncharacterized protein LOC126906751 [Daktulosphaira vitifoliae]
MFPLKIFTSSFLLYSVILYTNAKMGLIEQLDKLLQYSGWNNLNDLKFIHYYKKPHFIQHLEATPTRIKNYDYKVRVLTIYLGCTYAKVMQNLYPIIRNLIQDCQRKFYIKNDFINGCFSTKKLLNIISSLIVPLATLLKGAMNTLYLLRNKPWCNMKSYSYMVSFRLEKFENIFDHINKHIQSHYNIFAYHEVLKTVDNFFIYIMSEINNDTTQFCVFVPFDKNCLWNECIQEYKPSIDVYLPLLFLEFITKKIKNYIQTVITEKYFHLGFIFDPITEETTLATSEDLMELELEFKETDEYPLKPILIETL